MKTHNLIRWIGSLEPEAVVLYLRVSTKPNQSHQDQQEGVLKRYCRKHGIKILAVYREAESGWKDLPKLKRAAQYAKRTNAVVLAESLDRFVRNRDYHTTKAEPREADFERLKRIVGGATLATLHPPDESAKAIRRRQMERGQQASGKKGGRPRKPELRPKEKRERFIVRAFELRDSTVPAMSYDKIEESIQKETGFRIPASTIRDWHRRYRNG